MKWAWMVSVTSMVASGVTTTSERKSSMRSWRVLSAEAAGKSRVEIAASSRNGRRMRWRTRIMRRATAASWGGGGGGHGEVAGVDCGGEGALLVAGIACSRFHQIGNQVIAALELDVDIRPGVIGRDVQAHQAVVHPDQE